MNLSVVRWCATSAIVGVVPWIAVPTSARAQAVGSTAAPTTLAASEPSIPIAAQSATSVDAYQPTIVGFLKYFVGKLSSDDAAVRQKAREAIGQHAPSSASSAYLQAYSSALASAIGPAVAASAPLPTRLNAAIAVARVAGHVSDDNLASVADTLMSDASPAVVLWGVKAAGGVLAHTQGAKATHLIDRVSQAATAGAVDGPIVANAYDALTFNHITPNPALFPMVTPAILNLLTERVKQYAAGTVADPLAERTATTFLTTVVWSQSTPQQQVQTAQLICQVLDGGAKRFIIAKPPEREAWMQFLTQEAKAAFVLGELENSDAVKAAASQLINLSGQVTPDTVTADVQALGKAIQAIPKFADIQTDVGPAGATTQTSAAAG